MRSIGALMQRLALVLPIVAILLQIMDQISVGKMLVIAVAAISMFYLGRLLEGYAGS